ncbi:MAG TPA: DNA-formamidopyrimidine glycosylase family protein [Acidimicrobiia bacterium]|nr:DNA-formamidopyrimidine glycosylase family protein [Acidimicrobiia bacterium]
MPEGDSVAGHARRLRPVLVGRRIESVNGTAPPVRVNSRRILDATVNSIRTVGKHLIFDLSTGYSIRVHLGLSGRWVISASGKSPHGSARLALATSSHHAACYGAPTIEVDRTPAVDASVAGLGPDLLGDVEFDVEEYLRRARLRGTDRSVSRLLLDQEVIAGIGNVYKSELLFLEGIHPDTPVKALSDDALRSVATRARRLLAANVGAGPRVTTGLRGAGRELWVYGRRGSPCRRCGTAIESSGGEDRVTYWCPACQPL